MSKESTSEAVGRICRTCLKPIEPLIEDGGVLFCRDCRARYKDLLGWMKGDSDHQISYERFMAEYQVPYSPNPLEAHLEGEHKAFADWMVRGDSDLKGGFMIPPNPVPYPRQTSGDLDAIPEEIEKARRDFLGF